MLEIYTKAKDSVIEGIVCPGVTNYKYAVESIFELVDKYEAQRKLLDKKIYSRLEKDILDGCLMPPITLAFISSEKLAEADNVRDYVIQHINDGYVLDGIQRLHTLKRASEKDGFNEKQSLFVNVIITEKKDFLLYRMITLNNGQRAMSARHQIEILTEELFDFANFNNIAVQTEKEKSDNPDKKAFSYAEISKGYLAFLTNNLHNENSKIIEQKMDELIVERIMDTNLSELPFEFSKVLEWVNKVSVNETIRTWLQVGNNFIGLCVGIKTSFDELDKFELEALEEGIKTFERAFKAINPSKVNVGKVRRDLSNRFIRDISEMIGKSETEFLETFVENNLA